jgi:hypothetical protein
MLYLDESLPNHPKILRAGELIGGKGGALLAVGLYVTAIAYARHMLTDGVVPAVVLDVCPRSSPKTLSPAAALTRVGLLKKDRLSYTVHDYHDWNPSAEKAKAIRENARLRKAKWRERHGDVTAGQARDDPGTDPGHARLRNGHGTESTQYPVPSTHKEGGTGEVPVPRQSNGQRRAAAGLASPQPIIRKRRMDAAWEGVRLYVPIRLHQDFCGLRNHDGAEAELFAWYESVAEEWTAGAKAQQSPGADMFAFWKARFDEQWPPTKAAVRSRQPAWAEPR